MQKTPLYLNSLICQNQIGVQEQKIGESFNSLDEYFLKSSSYRTHNSIVESLEKKIALLEQTEDALAVVSLNIALSSIVYALLQDGDHILVHETVSGELETWLYEFLPSVHVHVDRANFSNLTSIEENICKQTKMMLIEFPSIPFLEVFDLESCIELAHKKNILCVVNHTMLSPVSIQPSKYGADIVISSLKEYCACGKNIGAYFASNKMLLLQIRRIVQLLDVSLPEKEAICILDHLQTLAVRIEKISKNASIVVNFLQSHPRIETMYYIDATYPNVQKQLTYTGGICYCKLKTNQAGTLQFLNRLKHCSIQTMFGGLQTTLEYPTAMSYLLIPTKKQTKLGIEDNLVRISVGLEQIEDILRDIDQALLG
ncbi:MAG TPA: PLP-dependent transferase [Planctomycetota bacterium]|jgi:cystathionine beta-lyase/cystathionine gamma-synthase|nr:PLP-dependent transferase [Planctomycetota bacterium]HQB00085.1 PLP-dependent transferase [Planctomycetota bacterium]HRU51004.1 PLP-dependent transferase [Planctomycetota bacterium]